MGFASRWLRAGSEMQRDTNLAITRRNASTGRRAMSAASGTVFGMWRGGSLRVSATSLAAAEELKSD